MEAADRIPRRVPGPAWRPGLDLCKDTGVTLVTDQPVDGIESITSEEALELCWG